MFSFFRRKPAPPTGGIPTPEAPTPEVPTPEVRTPEARTPEVPPPEAHGQAAAREGWISRLRHGLRRTGSAIAQVFTGTRIDEALYEELEAALLMSDAGVQATAYLLEDLKRRVKDSKATDPAQVKGLLAQALADLLQPLQRSLSIGEAAPTVMMVVGVNGAGKTTSIGKLTRHLADHGQTVLLAAGDTFRAAAREQLAAWAVRNDEAAARGAAGPAGLNSPGSHASNPSAVEIVSQEGGDPGAVGFDAVQAGRARSKDVVIVDTAGRLPTQLHLMEELRKIKRVIGRAMEGAPHEVLLVVDGNTGQNALAQVKAFDQALGLTGLIVTKLDGTAKGGVLAAVALWGRERRTAEGVAAPVPVYFIGVGERLEDLQTFDALEFAQALLG